MRYSASDCFRFLKTYEINTNTVSISSIYGLKGLDYSVTFMLVPDFLELMVLSVDQLDRLTCVAVTKV